MKILITGSSGFVGRELCKHLSDSGHQIIPLLRDFSNFVNADAVINLAGEPIGEGRWTMAKKNRIRDTRIEGSKKLLKLVETQPHNQIKIIISASAIGYYGDRGGEVLTEESGPGSGFLSEVCQSWERQTLEHVITSTRRVAMRFGIVLGHGGALDKISIPFKIGLGGPLGDGQQWMSWIHIKDLVKMIDFILNTKEIAGAVNAVAPTPITNFEFSKILAEVLKTKSRFAAPAFVLKFLLAEKSELLLSSQRVVSDLIIKHGFKFEYANLKSALIQIFEGDSK